MNLFYPKIFLLVFTILVFSKCKNNKPNSSDKVDPMEAAMPHGTTLPDAELSAADKTKLAAAKGKSAFPFSASELDSMLKYSEDQLHIYAFWKMADSSSLVQNRILQKIQNELGEDAFRLMFVSLDDSTKVSGINSFIRTHNVTSTVLYPSDSLSMDWYGKVNHNWLGEVPSIYLLNQSDGTDLFYSKSFSYEELLALIQPFVL